MTTSARKYLAEKLKSKVYRDTYVAENIRSGIAAQIRATREDRKWTQRELGEKLGMAQATVSQLEDPNYGRLTLATLRRLASAFDVALVVRFVPFSDLVDWMTNFTQSDLAVRGFEEDHLLEPSHLEVSPMAGAGGSQSRQDSSAPTAPEAIREVAG